MCKNILRACRALLPEFRIRKEQWPEVVALIQNILNHSKRPALGDRALIMIFTSLSADKRLQNLFAQRIADKSELALVNVRRTANTDRLLRAVAGLHKEVHERNTRKRKDAIEHHKFQAYV